MTGTIAAAKSFHWDMAHRLGDGYPSQCRHLHGHRYSAEVTVRSDRLDEYGMVMDFGDISRICDGWIQEHLDHACLVSSRDTSLLEFLRAEKNRFFQVDFNTTVEGIAAWLAQVLQAEIDRQPHLSEREVRIVRIRLHETPRSFAEWSR